MYSISQEICTRFFALLCFVVVIQLLIFPYPSGLLHWHCGNLTIAPVPAKQPWWIWINTSCEFIMNDCITTTKQSTTKLCAYFLGYTVCYQLTHFICVERGNKFTSFHCLHEIRSTNPLLGPRHGIIIYAVYRTKFNFPLNSSQRLNVTFRLKQTPYSVHMYICMTISKHGADSMTLGKLAVVKLLCWATNRQHLIIQINECLVHWLSFYLHFQMPFHKWNLNISLLWFKCHWRLKIISMGQSITIHQWFRKWHYAEQAKSYCYDPFYLCIYGSPGTLFLI